MTVGDSMPHPVDKLGQQHRVGMAGFDSFPHLHFDQISCVPQLGGIVHVADITSPQRPALDNAEQAGEGGVMVQRPLGDICV
jgi:hypothetical protein